MYFKKKYRIANLRLKKQVRYVLNSPKVEWEGFNKMFNKQQSFKSKILWVIIEIICLATVCSQTVDRIIYFLSFPINVNIAISETKVTSMPVLQFYAIDNPALLPYWNQTSITSEYKTLKCLSPTRSLILETDTPPYWNYKELWDKAFVDGNLDEIKIISPHKKVLFHQNKVENTSYSNWRRRYLAIGSSLTFSTDKQVDVGSKLEVTFVKHYPTFCDVPRIVIGFVDDLFPYRYVFTLPFGNRIRFSYKQREYKIIRDCEEKMEIIQNCISKCMTEKSKQLLKCRLPPIPDEVIMEDCSTIASKSKVTQVYKKTAFMLMFEVSDCGCKRPCDQKGLSIQLGVSQFSDKDKIRIDVFQDENYAEIMTEEQAYYFGNLMADFGGSLGLFLSLSIVSIAQIGHVILFSNFQNSNNSTPNFWADKKRKNKIEKIVLKFRIDSEKKLFKTRLSFVGIVNAAFIIALTCLLVYMVVGKTRYYLTTPTKFIVLLEANITMYLPNIIGCGEGDDIAAIKQELSPDNPCAINFLDLLDQNMSIMDIWDKQRLPVDEIQADIIMASVGLKEDLDDTSFVTVEETSMHTGKCDEFSFVPYKYGGMASTLIMKYLEFSDKCHDGLWEMYIRPPGHKVHTILRSKQYIQHSNTATLEMRIFKLSRFNSTSNPCMGVTEFNNCRDKCLETLIKNSIDCRLPFMDYSNSTYCDTSFSAKNTLATFMEKSLKTDLVKDCKCLKPCEETVFIPKVHIYEPNTGGVAVLLVYTLSNMIESFNEESSYSIVALFCDYGNILGLSLGVSVFTVMTVAEKLYLKLKLSFKSH